MRSDDDEWPTGMMIINVMTHRTTRSTQCNSSTIPLITTSIPSRIPEIIMTKSSEKEVNTIRVKEAAHKYQSRMELPPVPKLGHLIDYLIESWEDIIRKLDLSNSRSTGGGVADRHALEKRCNE